MLYTSDLWVVWRWRQDYRESTGRPSLESQGMYATFGEADTALAEFRAGKYGHLYKDAQVTTLSDYIQELKGG